jgi:hypothetical protein
MGCDGIKTTGKIAGFTTRQLRGMGKKVVYAELMEYARRITKKYEKAFAGVRAIEQAEREKQALGRS